MKQSTNKLKSDYQGQSMIPVGSERDHPHHNIELTGSTELRITVRTPNLGVDKCILARQG